MFLFQPPISPAFPVMKPVTESLLLVKTAAVAVCSPPSPNDKTFKTVVEPKQGSIPSALPADEEIKWQQRGRKTPAVMLSRATEHGDRCSQRPRRRYPANATAEEEEAAQSLSPVWQHVLAR